MGRGWVHGHRLVAGAAKGKLFTKLSKEITVAVRLGGADEGGNARLRAGLREARKSSMPKDTIDRAIKKGLGPAEGEDYEEITYEGYGPHNVAFVVETLTDNRNRTAQDLRSLFTKHGTGLGTSGSVMWLFERVGSIIAKGNGDAEEIAIEAGANDVKELEDDLWHFISSVNDFSTVQDNIEKAGWDIDKANLGYIAKTEADITEEQENDVQEFMQKLEDHDDVKKVYLNL